MITPISIDMASLNIPSLVPMLIAILGGLLILCIDLFTKNTDKFLYVTLTVLILAVDLLSLIGYDGPVRGFFDVMLVDGISILGQIIIVVASALFIFLSLTKEKFHEFKAIHVKMIFLSCSVFCFFTKRNTPPHRNDI